MKRLLLRAVVIAATLYLLRPASDLSASSWSGCADQCYGNWCLSHGYCGVANCMSNGTSCYMFSYGACPPCGS